MSNQEPVSGVEGPVIDRLIKMAEERNGLRAQIACVRRAASDAEKRAPRWDTTHRPCWCDHFKDQHESGCLAMRQLLRRLEAMVGTSSP